MIPQVRRNARYIRSESFMADIARREVLASGAAREIGRSAMLQLRFPAAGQRQKYSVEAREVIQQQDILRPSVARESDLVDVKPSSQ
jgi:hypothetical protein